MNAVFFVTEWTKYCWSDYIKIFTKTHVKPELERKSKEVILKRVLSQPRFGYKLQIFHELHMGLYVLCILDIPYKE